MNNKYDVLKLDSQLCFPLYAVSREIVKRYTPLLNEINLTYTQYITLLVLWEHKKMLIKELGRKLFLDSGTLTPVVNSLEKKGFVVKRRSQTDKRDMFVEITETAMQLREKALSIPEKVGSCLPLEKDDAIALYRILHQMMDKM